MRGAAIQPLPQTKKEKNMAEENKSSLDPLAALCKRRGFIYHSSEIYGGMPGFWD